MERKPRWMARELGLQLILWRSPVAKNTRAHSETLSRLEAVHSQFRRDPLSISNQKQIADLAIKNRLPVIYPRADLAASGGLMSYGRDRDRTLQACRRR